MRKRLFSGIQPTGRIHIGNYLGAIWHWVAGQADFDNIFSIVDLHALTVPPEPGILKAQIREAAGLLLAAGIDPEKSALFVQSHISAHAELAWILNCLIPVGWMQRMTQFKEKSKSQREQASVGLFDYPALMAADILLYETDLVPVGEDQTQHLELTRDVAQRFNARYGEVFKLPAAAIPPTGARIMGLDDPLKKMSKSEQQPSHTIYLLDSAEEIRAKIMRATTDSVRSIRFDPSRPGIYNLLVIYELFSGESRSAIEARFQDKGYAELKQELAEVIIAGLRPLQARYHALSADPAYMDAILTAGAAKVRPIAENTLNRVKYLVGLG